MCEQAFMLLVSNNNVLNHVQNKTTSFYLKYRLGGGHWAEITMGGIPCIQ